MQITNTINKTSTLLSKSHCKCRYYLSEMRSSILMLGGKIMTSNQLAYWAQQETKQHNRETERETNRSNLAREGETARHNKAAEDIDFGKLAETTRHNQVNEDIDYGKLNETKRSNQANEAIKRDTLDESIRHNKAGEELTSQKQAEDQRHNQVTEAETYRSNTAKETEEHRKNTAREQEEHRSNTVKEEEEHRSNVHNETIAEGRAAAQNEKDYAQAQGYFMDNYGKQLDNEYKEKTQWGKIYSTRFKQAGDMIGGFLAGAANVSPS